MKHKIFALVLLVLLIIGVIAIPDLATATGKAKIRSVKFSLYKSNGPIYVDVNGYCPAKTYVAYWPTNDSTQAIELAKSGLLNGSTRFWPEMQPKTRYDVEIGCVEGNDEGVSRYYRVSFQGNRISVIRR